MKKSTKIGLTILVVFISVVMMGGVYFYSLLDKVQPNDIDKDVDGIVIDNSIVDEKETDLKEYEDKQKAEQREIVMEKEGITNILLIGVDDRKDGNGARGDTIMILTLDDIHKKIKLTSILRDSYVSYPGFKSKYREIPEGSRTKIGHAYGYGGSKLLIGVIERNFKVKIDHWVRIDFDGFKALFTSVGGIDAKITGREMLNELNRCLLLEKYEDKRFKDEQFRKIIDKANLLIDRDSGAEYLIIDNPHITEDEYQYIADKANFVYETGQVHLNGTQALAFARMRHATGGSEKRTERQRGVVSLVLNELKGTPETKYLAIINEMINYVRTDASPNQILNLAYKAIKINNFNIDQLQIPTEKLSQNTFLSKECFYENDYNYNVFAFDRQNVKKVMQEFVFEDINYNSDNYKEFNAAEAGYDIYHRPKRVRKPKNDDKQDEKLEDKKQDNDKKKEETDSDNATNESKEQDEADSQKSSENKEIENQTNGMDKEEELNKEKTEEIKEDQTEDSQKDDENQEKEEPAVEESNEDNQEEQVKDENINEEIDNNETEEENSENQDSEETIEETENNEEKDNNDEENDEEILDLTDEEENKDEQ